MKGLLFIENNVENQKSARDLTFDNERKIFSCAEATNCVGLMNS